MENKKIEFDDGESVYYVDSLKFDKYTSSDKNSGGVVLTLRFGNKERKMRLSMANAQKISELLNNVLK